VLIAVGTLGAYAAHPYMQAGAALVQVGAERWGAVPVHVTRWRAGALSHT
jgi:hypothetical protein